MKSILERDYRLLKISPYKNEVLKLEFKGNIDIAIEKMKKDILVELTEENQLKLKIYLLFLCGMPFSQIAENLSVTKGKISRCLSDEKLSDLLSFEYQVLFEKNKFRLKTETTEEKMRKAVETFVEQNGSYKKIMECTGFSERTLSRYFCDPKLEQIINDPKLYQAFLETSKRHISEIKSQAGTNGMKNKQLKKKISEIVTTDIVHKKYIALCQALLLDGVRDMKSLMSYTGMTEENISYYIKNLNKSGQFLGEEIINMLRDVYAEIIHDKEQQITSENYDMLMLKLYMDSRYSRSDIQSIFYASANSVNNVLDEKSKILLSEEEYKRLEEHKKELAKLGRRANYVELIKDPRLIKIVKKEIKFVKLEEYHILTLVLDFMDLYQVIVQNDSKVDLISIARFLSLKLNKLEELLNSEVYKIIVEYLHLEELLNGNQLKEKYNYITNTVHELFKNNLDLIKTAQVLDIPVECLIRVLENEYVAVNYGILISENIKEVIKQFREEVNKVEEKTLSYNFLLKNK